MGKHNGNEVKYNLVKKRFNGGWSKKKYLVGKNLPSNDTVEAETCLSPTRCYRFKIINSGWKQRKRNRNTSYTILTNGKLKKNRQLNKRMEKTLIGASCWT